MSITAYTGLPGHGKSYGVVENVIVPALRAKRKVLTNIPMNLDECLKQFQHAPEQFGTQDIIDDPAWWETNCPGAVVVLDEVWRVWPAGVKANNVREQDKSFLAEHRHMVGDNGQSTEIVLVTQDLSQIASFARVLVETTFRVVKLSKLGLDKRFRVDVYFGPVTGPSPSISKREREIHGQFKKEVYALYKSHTKSLTGGAGNEARTDQRFNVLKGGKVKLFFVVLFAAGFLFMQGIKKVSAGYGASEVSVAPSVSASSMDVPVEAMPVQSVPVRKIFKFLSDAERITIDWNNGHFPDIDYRVSVRFKDYEGSFTLAELRTLEYEVVPVNDCMIRIVGPDYNGFAMCPRSEPPRGWVESMVVKNPEST